MIKAIKITVLEQSIEEIELPQNNFSYEFIYEAINCKSIEVADSIGGNNVLLVDRDGEKKQNKWMFVVDGILKSFYGNALIIGIDVHSKFIDTTLTVNDISVFFLSDNLDIKTIISKPKHGNKIYGYS